MISYIQFVYLFHILFVGPLLAYIGYAALQGNKINEKVLQLTVFLGISTAIYHGFLLYKRIQMLNK